MIGDWAGDLPVSNLCQKNTYNNRKLIQTDQSAAYRCWTDLGDIQGRDIGAEPNRSSAHNPPKDKGGEGIGPPGKSRGEGKKQRRDEKNPFAAKTFSTIASQEGT